MKHTSKQLLKHAKVPALLVSNPSNVRYLTGLPLEDALLLVTSKGYVLYAGKLEIEMAQASGIKGVKIRPWKGYKDMFAQVRTCGFEADNVKVSEFFSWKKIKNLSLKPVEGAVEHFRRSKDEGEMKTMLRAHAITEELLRRIPSALKVNVTEKSVSWKIETWAHELGAEGMSFPTIVAFGKNTSRPHHRPTDKKLKKRDIVQVDLGASYKGYCSDRSDVYFTAKPTAEQQRIYDALVEAKNAAIDAVKVGASTKKLDETARNVLKKYKLEKYFTHSLGHGVGIDIHEGVTLSSRGADDYLMEHEVITIEPGVYIPGKFGMRLEDMVIVE